LVVKVSVKKKVFAIMVRIGGNGGVRRAGRPAAAVGGELLADPQQHLGQHAAVNQR
jgi:hypothetical protein